jgi:hypothetical protein
VEALPIHDDAHGFHDAMGIVMNVNCFIHDDAHCAFVARPRHNLGVSANTPTPADLFIQSVVKRDAAMGWHQLCSSVQSQVPLSALVGQVEKQRIAEAGTKLLERGYLLVFEALQIPTNEGSPRIQQSKMMLSQR